MGKRRKKKNKTSSGFSLAAGKGEPAWSKYETCMSVKARAQTCCCGSSCGFSVRIGGRVVGFGGSALSVAGCAWDCGGLGSSCWIVTGFFSGGAVGFSLWLYAARKYFAAYLITSSG